MIPDYTRHLFTETEQDDKITILNKRYFLDKDRINRKTNTQQSYDEFNKKYNSVMKMKRNTNIEKLKFELALSELLD